MQGSFLQAMPYLVGAWDTGEEYLIHDHKLQVETDGRTESGVLALLKRNADSNCEDLTEDTLLDIFGVELSPRLVFQTKALLCNWAIWSLPPDCAEETTASRGWGELLDSGYTCRSLLVQPAANEQGESIGYGLFATVALGEGEFIGEYTGVVRTSAAVSGFDSYGCIYPNCQEAMHISASEYGNIIRFINHSPAHNVAFRTVSHEGLMHVVCVTTRPIVAGEELLVDYGENYWQGYEAAERRAADETHE